MRFFWKATPDSRDHAGVKCKIVRAVNFTQTIDVYDMCTEKVQEDLCENRLADEKEENSKFAKKRGLDEEEAKKSSPSIKIVYKPVIDPTVPFPALSIIFGKSENTEGV